MHKCYIVHYYGRVRNNFERKIAQITVFLNHHYSLRTLLRCHTEQKKAPEIANVHARSRILTVNSHINSANHDNARNLNSASNRLIHEYFEVVLRNRKTWTPISAPCSVIAVALDRKYKYGRRFVKYKLVTKVSWY